MPNTNTNTVRFSELEPLAAARKEMLGEILYLTLKNCLEPFVYEPELLMTALQRFNEEMLKLSNTEQKVFSEKAAWVYNFIPVASNLVYSTMPYYSDRAIDENTSFEQLNTAINDMADYARELKLSKSNILSFATISGHAKEELDNVVACVDIINAILTEIDNINRIGGIEDIMNTIVTEIDNINGVGGIHVE